MIAAVLAVAASAYLIYFNVVHSTSPRMAVIGSAVSLVGAATVGTAGYAIGRLLEGDKSENPE